MPPASATPASAQRLKTQAWAQLNELLAKLETQAGKDRQATTRLNDQIAQKLHRERSAETPAADEHTYGVFAVGEAAKRRMVLRDVVELDGRPPLSTTNDFGEALRSAGAQIEDNEQPPPPRSGLHIATLRAQLAHLLARLRELDAGNARLLGDGTADSPYASAGDAPIHVAAPCTLGLADVPAAQAVLWPQQHRLCAAQKSPAQ